MKKDEALAKGFEIHETKHSMKRRSPWHDYNRKGTYMLTLVVEGRKPLFGRLCGESAEEAHVELTELGWAVRDEEVKKISLYYPMVEVWKVCVMPDHLHLIVHIKEQMPQGKHLGQVMAGFKGGCSRAWWQLQAPADAQGTVTNAITVPSASAEVQKSPLFEPGYNDKILFENEQLENWKHYLDQNPQRLWIKRKHPQSFIVLHDLEVAGHKCQIVGNRFLLTIPDKMAVIVHRRYIEEENARLREEWLACGERGGVLVSAAISSKEKEIMREAMDRGYRINLLRENGFPELYKPSGEAFYACSEGRLLQISPWDYHMEKKTITREQCLQLNKLATDIISMK